MIMCGRSCVLCWFKLTVNKCIARNSSFRANMQQPRALQDIWSVVTTKAIHKTTGIEGELCNGPRFVSEHVGRASAVTVRASLLMAGAAVVPQREHILRPQHSLSAWIPRHHH